MTNPIITYSPNGNKRFEKYYLNGHYHRDPEIGPARISYDENGKIRRQTYSFNGKVHNPYGPAIIDTKYDYDIWAFNDKEYTRQVNKYLDKNNLTWQNMTKIDFDIMWTCIL